MTIDLQPLFDDYRASISTPMQARKRDDLYVACKFAVKGLRLMFPHEDHVGGDKFEEAFEDAFLRCTNPDHLPQIDDRGFKSFFFRTVNNAMIDEHRRQHPRRQLHVVSLDALGKDPTHTVTVDSLEVAEARQIILNRLAKLPESDRRLIAKRIDDMKYDEISVEEHKPSGTIRSWLHRAHKHVLPIMHEIMQYNAGVRAQIHITADDVINAREGRAI